MSCFIVEKFCGMSLPTAGVVIGWLSAVTYLIQSIICIAILVNLETIVSLIHFIDEIPFGKFGILIAVSFQLVIYLLDSVASILLLIGIKKNSHLMLLPFLIHYISTFGLKWISVSVIFKTSIRMNIDVPPVSRVVIAGIAYIILGIQGWSLSAIYSLFRNIRASKDLNDRSVNYEMISNS